MWMNILLLGGLGIGGLVAAFGLKPVLIGFMNTYRKANVLMLKLRGRTPENEAERRIVTGQAWEEWCDALKAAGATLLSPGCPDDPFTQAEGYRYLTRLVRASLEAFMECADTDAPRLVAIANGNRAAPVKIGSDNPSNLYLSASISGRKEYVVSVQRGTVHYLGFGTQSGTYGGPGGLQTVDYKEASDFEQNEDGTFQIVLSNERPEGCKNWLKTVPDPERGLLIVRQTYEDRETEKPADVSITCTSGNSKPSPCSAAAVDEALSTSATFVAGAPIMFARWAHGFQKHSNEFPLFDQETSNKVGGDPNIRYYHSYWKLSHDQALVVTATPPEVESWNFQLNNHWMESLDYRYYTIEINRHTAKYRSDGSVVLVITTHDPAKLPNMFDAAPYNWITTTGHTCGTMCFRWIRPKTDVGLPAPKPNVVNIKELPALLGQK